MPALSAKRIFDGTRFHHDAEIVFDNGRVVEIRAVSGQVEHDLIVPGFVDLQVNGGGGVMLNDAQSVDALATIANAHLALGTTSILPTLITDSDAQIDAAMTAAMQSSHPSIIGLHLEGPHLNIERKGAHDEQFIRPLSRTDVQRYGQFEKRLKITLAPESNDIDMIRSLADAGIVVSLGHSAARYDQALSAADAGAQLVTHLHNAMSQITGRDPGLVGVALDGDFMIGLIADGIHVHPANIRRAMHLAKGRIFLVSDAMAVAGVPQTHFFLNGRKITRHDGALRLANGTLAGADLDMLGAVRFMVGLGYNLDTIIPMATRIPAKAIQINDIGGLNQGQFADMLILDNELKLISTLQRGKKIGA